MRDIREKIDKQLTAMKKQYFSMKKLCDSSYFSFNLKEHS